MTGDEGMSYMEYSDEMTASGERLSHNMVRNGGCRVLADYCYTINLIEKLVDNL